MNKRFKEEVLQGLTTQPKSLPSKYFYDQKGDDLFVQIMNMPEYYLTRAEFEIFALKTKEIIALLQLEKHKSFQLIELGAGDGKKTKELLKALMNLGFEFEYHPIDISQNALKGLKKSLQDEIPDLICIPQQGEYFQILEKLKTNDIPKVILFLGSNIGNMLDQKAHLFIHQLGANMNMNDKLVLGVDMIKPKEIVLPAYNDSKGITAEFNLNLLDRINRELGANFNRHNFEHQPEYDETEGIARSYIQSTCDQEVVFSPEGLKISFREGEKIHTEISRKYNDEIIREIIEETDFEIRSKLLDSKNYFADYFLERT